ncbi:Maf family protein [Streptomyces yaizuensis]|uniref:Nucleoside triphosphate pyrophosphatase n=1 Tax=Streptomyces yaizuensis TaxID=2989713 RepID=A0ABQ5NRA7_9ACTN|nr:nucleoside triphosphate pyrophosphatase [Streptomyces sp. YSPA8]GLF92907.1 Maf family nucleotide pyrophosphatase [Streptomyces sp. YSPA8]
MTRVVLASGSPSRLDLLRRAGLDPEVVVSGADESALPGESPSALTLRLARAKATTVADTLDRGVVIGCDSLLELDGLAHGKPGSAGPAIAQWRRMAGRTAVFHTGHCVVDAASGRRVAAVCSTEVTFARPTDEEIARYVASGEPLAVAGAFKISHKGGWFVESVSGEPGNLQGLSLPLLRRLLAGLGVGLPGLWG